MSDAPPLKTTLSRWFCVADLIFLLLLFGIVQRAKGSMLDDPGLGWHLRNVDAMIEQRNWLSEDPFSGPRAGAKYYTNQWLGDVMFWLGYKWGDLEGIAAVATIVIALIFRSMYRMLERDGLPVALAFGWTYLGVLGTSLSFVARPNVFAILFVMITARVCESFHRGISKKKHTWLLAPMFIAWANIHSSFLAGLILVAATGAVELALAIALHDSEDRKASFSRFLHWCGVGAVLLLCTMINPYSWKLIPWIRSLLGDDYFMKLNTEWQSPDFNLLGAFRYEFIILVFPLIMLFTRRINWIALVHSMLFFHLALSGRRYVALFVVVTVPMLAKAFAESSLLDWLKERFPFLTKFLSQSTLRKADVTLTKIEQDSSARSLVSFSQDPGDVPPASARSAPFVFSLLCAIGLLVWAKYERNFAYIKQEHIPTGVLDKLLAIHQDGEVVFHHYNWGGYLTWHGWPKLKIWIDDRNEVQGKEHTREFFEMLNYFPGTLAKLRKANVKYICIPPNFSLASRLEELPDEWEEIHRGEFAVLYRRKSSP